MEIMWNHFFEKKRFSNGPSRILGANKMRQGQVFDMFLKTVQLKSTMRDYKMLCYQMTICIHKL